MKNSFHIVLTIVSIVSAFGIKILPDVEESIMTSNESLTLTCINGSPITWTFPNPSLNKTINEKFENGSHISDLKLHSANFLDTGYFICESKLNKSENDKIYIYVFDEEELIALSEPVVIIHGTVHEDLVIPCKPTSPKVNVTLEGEDGVAVSNLNYDPKIGFIIPSVQVTDFNTFNCIASYNELSSSYQILISFKPHANDISTPKIDATTGSYHLIGDSATLNCSSIVSVGVKATLKWQFPNDKVENKAIVEKNREVPYGERRMLYRILTIHNISKEDQGHYICRVENLNDIPLTSTYLLEVNDPDFTFLNITAEAGSHQLTVRSGQPQVKWVVNITAHPRPAITWYNPEGKPIADGVSYNGKYVVSNDGRITKLEINKISIWDFGIYQLYAFNTHHKAAIDFALFVEDKPIVEMKKDREFYKYGNVYSIECLYTAYPLPRVIWSAKNCQDYTIETCNDTAVFQSISTNTQNSEEISMNQYKHKSVYEFVANETKFLRCEADNSMGSSNFSLLFLVADVEDGFAISSDTNSSAVGDDVKITCTASIYAYYDNITWFLVKSDDWIPIEHVPGMNMTRTRSKFSHIATLYISNIQKSHNGNYMCQGTFLNRMPVEFAEKSISLNVKDVQMPFIFHSNLNSSTWPVASGTKIELKAFVGGIPTPTVIWYKNGKPLEIKRNDTRLILINRNQTLLIKYTAFADEGSYSFVAENKVGNVTGGISLRLTDKMEEHEHPEFVWSFLILAIFSITCIFWSMVRIRKEKKLRKELAEDGLLNFEEGAINSLNPELGIEDQADLLPYDKKWEFPRNKLKFGKQLGSGAFGVVMKAEADGIIKENTWTTVAVKMVKREVDPMYIKALVSELKIMIHLGRHLNVVNLLGACTKDINKRELVVIVEFCKYGNLHDFLLRQRNNFVNQINENDEIDFSISRTISADGYTRMRRDDAKEDEDIVTKETPIGSDGYLINKDYEPDWRSNYCGDYRNAVVGPIKTADLICWSFQIARGMEYLASRKVLHGDLAARNVLLADDNVVKICDFGLAKSMYNSENYQRKKHELLPIRWMAIESIRDRVFSTQSDVWSFGITMWELFSLSVTPYPGVQNLEKLYTKLLSGHKLEKPEYATREIYAIMADCWHRNPMERPTFHELSQRIAVLLEEGIQSHYTNLDENYIKMNAETNTSIDYYLTMQNTSEDSTYEMPRYMNIPCRELSDPKDEVEMKPMLEKTETELKNAKPIYFFNQSYADLAKTKTSAYVNAI